MELLVTLLHSITLWQKQLEEIKLFKQHTYYCIIFFSHSALDHLDTLKEKKSEYLRAYYVFLPYCNYGFNIGCMLLNLKNNQFYKCINDVLNNLFSNIWLKIEVNLGKMWVSVVYMYINFFQIALYFFYLIVEITVNL